MFNNLSYLGGQKPNKVRVFQNKQGEKKAAWQKYNRKEQQAVKQQGNQKDNQTAFENKKKQIKVQDKQNNHEKKLESAIEQLKGSKFRMLNEFLYTENSEKALKHFSENEEDFKIYHDGFRSQTEKWPVKPVEVIIKELETNPIYQQATVCDLGCGEGFIYEHFRDQNRIKCLKKYKLKEQLSPEKNSLQKIYSFDLVNYKPFITKADSANLPLEDQQVDACIFCLALMGTNYVDFLIEATRVLKPNGRLIIAEVKSRIQSVELFTTLLKLLGYEIKKSQVMGKSIQNNKKQQKQQGNQQGDDFFYTIIGQKKQEVNLNAKRNTKISNISKEMLKKLEENPDFKQAKNKSTLQNLAELVLKPCIYKRR